VGIPYKVTTLHPRKVHPQGRILTQGWTERWAFTTRLQPHSHEKFTPGANINPGVNREVGIRYKITTSFPRKVHPQGRMLTPQFMPQDWSRRSRTRWTAGPAPPSPSPASTSPGDGSIKSYYCKASKITADSPKPLPWRGIVSEVCMYLCLISNETLHTLDEKIEIVYGSNFANHLRRDTYYIPITMKIYISVIFPQHA
jgi:hypothetical protein